METAKFLPLDYSIAWTIPRHVDGQAWVEHIPFAMTLVQMVRPRVLVELGVFTGDSYLSFCQAVEKLKLSTTCYGVDTWEGDPHGGVYGHDILQALRRKHDPTYGGFSTLMQSTFDQAVQHFADGSIDLLHIDGYHTYEAVRHDFETWLPKLSSRAVVLFHDINVRKADFGVWRFWDEISVKYPSMSFMHGYGLGVLAVGREVPEPLMQFLRLEPAELERVREFFFALGSRVHSMATTQQLEGHIAVLEGQLKASRDELASWQARYQHDTNNIKRAGDDTAAVLSAQIQAHLRRIAELEASMHEILASKSFRLGMMATAPLRSLIERRAR
ncbi:MAG: class I SAM-dependent methyltransferase [Myxococcales bacterium]|nr:class I SAM-dependent methyltransferase [Myxococcales bacterium]